MKKATCLDSIPEWWPSGDLYWLFIWLWRQHNDSEKEGANDIVTESIVVKIAQRWMISYILHEESDGILNAHFVRSQQNDDDDDYDYF